MAKAWVFQNKLHAARGKSGKWSVGWYENGTRKERVVGTKTEARDEAIRIESGQRQKSVRWSEFLERYTEHIKSELRSRSFKTYISDLELFASIAKPKSLDKINASMIDRFIIERRKQRGRNGQELTNSTINKQLRSLRAALKMAVRWDMLDKVPEIRFSREPEILPRAMPDADFASIYNACDSATKPEFRTTGDPAPVDWWRTLLVFLGTTGWRIGETLELLWRDVDLENGCVITRAVTNKGHRDERTPVPSLTIEHMRSLKRFKPEVFYWPNHLRTLYECWHDIQRAAGIKLECTFEHEHRETCHHYGFHDLRRAFATNNFARMSADELKQRMRHKSMSTTMRYVRRAELNKQSAEHIHLQN